MKRVYFIRPIGMATPIKVGCSMSPDGRRRTLETWSPFALEVIAEVNGGHDLERRLHALFADTHQRREWFGCSRQIDDVIAAIKDGSFDSAALPAPRLLTANSKKGKGTREAEWTPARRFANAYRARLASLRKRGMPFEILRDGPGFDYYAYSDRARVYYHKRAADPEAHIRLCEAFADKMTAQYGHEGLDPVRWEGAFPASAIPVRSEVMA